MNTPIQILARMLPLALALCFVGSRDVRAQSSAPAPRLSDASTPEYLLLIFTTVKPDRVAEFERLQKEEFNPALKKAGVTMRLASTRAVAGEGYQYAFGTPLKKFAELDEESWLTKSLGAAGAKALTEKIRACHVSTRTIIVRNIPDLSWGLETPMPYFVVTALQLVNGKKAEWLAYQRELAPALRKSGLVSHVVQETIYGGDNNTVYTLARFDRFADLDTNRLRDHMGEEAHARLMAKRPTSAVVRIERTLARHRIDLSIVPDQKPKQTE